MKKEQNKIQKIFSTKGYKQKNKQEISCWPKHKLTFNFWKSFPIYSKQDAPNPFSDDIYSNSFMND
ncbi:hypothetical protein DERP_000810 [Dermatophagoides pteronyssinus]|uniref:Uncharacterized protein n=1 Tax=Dermatophagoides pteronyssinus TaxID=6956 RepID=A0ABQ8J196_DERPT|nr:hypothetical protein DERP_000810 [Dermatophagoides pteronyssinus]